MDQFLAHLKKLTSALSAKQLLGLGTAFLAVVALVAGSAYWISAPSYTLLVADMDAETANAVVARLKSAKVPYELGPGGRTVSVPAERVDELRLELASDGLPSAGRIGFEIFDRPAFGTTEFLEQVNYRRALEGELARTISTFSEVSSARVHIAMAKDSLFVEREQPAKASVVLRLKANRPLQPSTIRGIANLVSGSVESLRPDSVVILDTFGRSLSRPAGDGEGSALDAADLDRQRQVERDLASRVVALLEPVVGSGHVRVNVAAHFTRNSVEETQEVWDPETVIRSQQTSTEITAPGMMAGGIAGARANQPEALSTAAPATGAAPPSAAEPPAAAPAGTPAGANGTDAAAAARPALPGRTSETTNYEIGRTTRHTISPQGQLARLSVAVIVDDEHVAAKAEDGTTTASARPRDPQTIQRIHGLVAAAVGLDPQRGDQLIVENIAFEVPSTDAEPPPAAMPQQVLEYVRPYAPGVLRTVAILTLALFALFGVIRPLARQATATAAAQALPAPAAAARLPTVEEMEGQLEADAARGGPGQRLPALTKRVTRLAHDEPEQLARVVRGWMAEDGR